MSQLKVNKIESTTSGGNCVVNATNISPRNILTNGDCAVNQRGPAPGGTAVSANNEFMVDRFHIAKSSSATIGFIQTENPGADGFHFGIKATCTSASSPSAAHYYLLRYKIEGYNLTRLNWGKSNAQPATLSFWVKSSQTGTFGGAIPNSNASRTYVFSYTVSSADTWERKKISIPATTSGAWLDDNRCGAELWFSLGVGSDNQASVGWHDASKMTVTGETQLANTGSGTMEFTGFQLERGEHMNEFEWIPYSQNLMECLRYFHRIEKDSASAWSVLSTSAVNRATNNTRCFFKHPVPLRALASWTISDVDDTRVDSSSTSHVFATNTPNSTTLLASYSTKEQTCVDFGSADTNIATGHASWLRSNNTAVTLDFSAEL